MTATANTIMMIVIIMILIKVNSQYESHFNETNYHEKLHVGMDGGLFGGFVNVLLTIGIVDVSLKCQTNIQAFMMYLGAHCVAQIPHSPPRIHSKPFPTHSSHTHTNIWACMRLSCMV